ncbi:FTR1 family protein [soil metagenome]
MLAPFLIMLREGFEAALVVALVFGYLRRIARLDLARPVWVGVAAAVGLSVVIGVVVRATIGDLEGAARLRSFALVSLLAVIVLTWMIFWMRRQSRLIKGDLEAKVDTALASSNIRLALVGVAFVAVLREGIEAALFLLALSTDGGGPRLIAGAALGLAAASVLALGIYTGGRAIPMRTFFRVTGVILIVFAAGLAARTVLFFQSAGDLGSSNLNGVYDVRSVPWLTGESEVGKFLSAILGWDPRPSIEQVVVWVLYLVPVLYLFLRTSRSVPTPDPPPPTADRDRVMVGDRAEA